MDGLGRVAQLFHHQGCGILIKRLVDGGHDTHTHQGLDDLTGFYAHALGQVTDGNHVRNLDLPGNEIRGSELAPLLLNLYGRRLPARRLLRR